MQKPTFDPGLTTQYSGPLRRAINRDGTFNVIRRGTDWRDIHPYLHLVSIPWTAFLGVIVGAYVVINTVFAVCYFLLGPGALQSTVAAPGSMDRFLQCFFFSSQTLTTVGFGALAPASRSANILAAFEALTGLLGFAVATGLLFGRVSKPSARIGFSQNALITPYQEGLSFQFRMANRRANTLIEPEVTVTMMTVVKGNVNQRQYRMLKLERDKIMMFPMTWTVVHPIDSESPLAGITPEELVTLEGEFMIMVKAWDDTFGQTVHQRYSYRAEEVVWGGKYTPAFGINEEGDMEVHVDKIGRFAPADLPTVTAHSPGIDSAK